MSDPFDDNFDPDGWSPWMDPDRPKMKCEKDGYDDGSYVKYNGRWITRGLYEQFMKMDRDMAQMEARTAELYRQARANLEQKSGEWIETSPGVWVKK